jgi:O-antigen ligase
MNSRPFNYTNSWLVNTAGADPQEPADPWQEPAGRLAFDYQGRELALLMAVGDYWGYLYATVDGAPANLLPVIPGNRNQGGELAGYRTFYAPEATTNGAPTAQWIPIHRSADGTANHHVELEIWRSWGQIPLRGVAVDALPAAPWPLWPGLALLLLGGGITVSSWSLHWRARWGSGRWWAWLANLLLPRWGAAIAPPVAVIGVTLLVVAIALNQWPLTIGGLVLLGWAALQRPVLWISALLLGLPFYFSFALPLLPGRAIGLIDVGILGGFVVSAAHWLLRTPDAAATEAPSTTWPPLLARYLLVALVGWALLATSEAVHQAVAWREWRTVFLYAGLLGGTLWLLQDAQRAKAAWGRDQWWLVGAWLAGSTAVALIALWQYGSGLALIEAEGVQRVRAFYGSPNNLALYLERTLPVVLAIAFLAHDRRWRWLGRFAGAIQGVALFLTFSKGALVLGLPTTLIILWLGGWLLLGWQGRSRRPLWWLAGTAILVALALSPFLATERFQRLFDFEQGTGFVRLQLWRSSWQMALDHPWLGVGPDNFLYAYRSQYLLPAAWQEPNLNHPHNWPLDWWTRIGLPGLLLAVAWFTLLVWRQWQEVRRGAQPVLALGLLAATAAALAHGLIDASYALPDLMLVWVLLSVLPMTKD